MTFVHVHSRHGETRLNAQLAAGVDQILTTGLYEPAVEAAASADVEQDGRIVRIDGICDISTVDPGGSGAAASTAR